MIHLPDSSQKGPSIQISPLLDMVFLLLVFFVVCTMYMSQQQGVPVELPQSTAQILKETPLEITMTKQGLFFYGNEQVTLQGLLQKARETARTNPKQAVTIRAAKELSGKAA